MDRQQTMGLLKELVNLNLVHPLLISVEKTHEAYNLIIKIEGSDGELEGLRQYLAKKKLLIDQHKKTGYYIISNIQEP